MSLSRAALGVLAVVAVASSVPLSGAAFTAETSSRGMLGASPDWTLPLVAVTGATGQVSGTTTIAMTASDAHSAVTDVRLEVRGSGSWSAVCTTTTSPYSCSWATAALPDGTYELRALATDTYGNTATSATVTRTVDNRGPVVAIVEDTLLDDLRGTVTVPVSATDAGSGVASVKVQRSTNGTTWTDICTTTTAPYSCSWTTGTSGEYLLRAIATDRLGNTTTSATLVVNVDNTAPAVTMSSPGTLLAGTVTLTATATDADSGVASVLIEQRPSTTSPWVAVCTDTTTPYSCRWDTTKVADGTSYAFRATATDAAGNVTVSAVTTTSTVDNRLASVSVEDPGAYLRGTVAVVANANAPGGVASVAIQYQLAGTSTWTAICTDTTSPYSCDWDTTKVAGGSYSLRAVMTPVTGSQLVSAVVSGRIVDNAPLRAHDVQAANGGVLGRVDANDLLTLTYDGLVDPASLIAGWDGTARSVGVRLRDGSAVGGAGGEDVLDVFTATDLKTSVNLGLVQLRGNYVKNSPTTLAGTLHVETTTVNGVQASRLVLRIGAVVGMDTTRTARGSRTLGWSPSTAARGVNGVAVAGTPVDELGALDRDF